MLIVPVLAQGDKNVVELMSGIFSRADTLTHPQNLVHNLSQMSIVWSVVFLIAGLVCLLNGFKFYKTVTVILALAIGIVAGYVMGRRIHAEFIVAGSLGLLLAIGCVPLMKYAVAVMGGLVGAFLGANVWAGVAHVAHNGQSGSAADHYWVGALIGLLMCGMLAFIVFKLSVVVFTSVSGATVAVMGALALLLQIDTFRPTISEKLQAHQVVIPLLVLVPAVIGLILQEAKPAAAGDKKGGDAKPKPATA